MGKFYQATNDEVKIISIMMASSFSAYPFVKNFLMDAYRNENERVQFLEKLCCVFIKTLMRKGVCFFEKEDDEVRAFCILSTMKYMKPRMWDMAASGAIYLLPDMFNKAVRQFMRFYLRDAAEVNFPTSENSWYVHLFAVSPNHQGNQLGTTMMNGCIFPYVEQRKGQRILLATNTKMALKFYTNNGFEVIANDEITYRGEFFKKWNLCKTIIGGIKE